MNKLYLILTILCLLVITASLSASAENTLEIRTAAFFHQSKKFRKIYGDVNADYQIAGSFALTPVFELWGEWDYLYSSKSKKDYKTRINLNNFDFGIRYVYSFNPQLDAYIGLGASVAQVRLHDKSFCGKNNHSKTVWGFVTKTGLRYWFYRNLFAEVFIDYLYQDAHFEKNANIGGLKVGAGLGVKF